MSEKHILIVEDENKIADLLKDYLENSGFKASILNRGDEVIAFINKFKPDLMLLDIMLPGLDGIDVCRETRKFSTIPIIMITAKVEEIDRLLGLELGADDYVCKPFSPKEVIARIKAVLRRLHSSGESDADRIASGNIELEINAHKAIVNNKELKLTPSEFKLLNIFISNPDRVFSRNELMNRVQGYEFDGYDRTIDSHIKNLRKKIAAVSPDKEIISSIYGEGYIYRR